MKSIAIDARSLQTEQFTGVSYYLKNILLSWMEAEKGKETVLYFNQKKRWLPQNNITNYYTCKQTYIPNKLLQLSWGLSKIPSISKHVKEGTIWLPNSNFLSIPRDKYIVLSLHDLSFIHFPEFYSKKMRLWHSLVSIKKLVKRSDHILTFSNASKEDIVEYFGKSEKAISVVPHGVDKSYFTFQNNETNYNLPEEYIAFVGSLEPRKNIITLIGAFEVLAQKFPQLKLVIAGSKGWLSKPVITSIERSSFSSRIQYRGYVSDEEKKAILHNAKVFVFPSFYEGFGLPVLEAMASGCPVVAGVTGSLPELLNTSGLLINPHQTHELISAVETILENQQLADMFIHSGKERAREYTWEKAATRTLSILNKHT